MILSSCANSLFYHPEEKVYQTPRDHNQAYEDVEFRSLDKILLSGWFIPAKDPSKCAGTIIHFHGNAQNMTSHYSYVRWVPELNYNLFALLCFFVLMKKVHTIFVKIISFILYNGIPIVIRFNE